MRMEKPHKSKALIKDAFALSGSPFMPGPGSQATRSLISFSGGKDSCLALYRARKAGFEVTASLTALEETGLRTRSHGVSRSLMRVQALALNLEPHFIAATWSDYESQFVEHLGHLRDAGLQHAIFGDIDLEAHREWEEKVCVRSGLKAQIPLWKEDRQYLVEEFLGLGFKAWVTCVDGRFLDASFAGREFDQDFIQDLPKGVDACGENGEFHTFVYDGPGFAHPVPWRSQGLGAYTSPPEYGRCTYHFDWLDCASP